MPIPPAPLQAKECQEHPVVCKLCEAAVPLSKLEIREHHHGNQAELCPDCGQLIELPVRAQHRDVCRNEQAQRGRGEPCALRRRRDAPRQECLSRMGCKGRRQALSRTDGACVWTSRSQVHLPILVLGCVLEWPSGVSALAFK